MEKKKRKNKADSPVASQKDQGYRDIQVKEAQKALQRLLLTTLTLQYLTD